MIFHLLIFPQKHPEGTKLVKNHPLSFFINWSRWDDFKLPNIQFLRDFSIFYVEPFSQQVEKTWKISKKYKLMHYLSFLFKKKILTIINRRACTWNRYKPNFILLHHISGIKSLHLAQSVGDQLVKKILKRSFF